MTAFATDAERDTGALVLAAVNRDEEGLAAVARNLADPAATAASLARLLAVAVSYCPEAAAELAAELGRPG